MDSATRLFTALYTLQGLLSGQVIHVPALEALESVRFKSRDAKKAKETLRAWDDQTEAFVETLHDVLRNMGLDS